MITIGPMTNLALAYYQEPRIAEWIEMVSLMGGNYTAIGLGRFFSAEFNVHLDTVAAHVVFSVIFLIMLRNSKTSIFQPLMLH